MGDKTGISWTDASWNPIHSCASTAAVPFFLKQAEQSPIVTFGEGSKRKAGGVIELPYLDGVQHEEFPR